MKTNNKANKIIYIRIMSIAVIFILPFSLIGCSLKQPLAQVNEFYVEFINTEKVKLSMGSAVTYAADNSVSKTLTATVLPETATNKAVDWYIEWGETTATGNVTDYVTVTPLSNGSVTATVTCKKAFAGNIIITITTRESGYSASCVVTFVGIPTAIALNGTVMPTGDTYKLGVGKTYDFSISLTNSFNSVGSQFNNFSYSLIGVGSVILGYMEHYNATGKDKWFDEINKTVTLDSLKDNFLTVSYANGILSVTTIKSIESYYTNTIRMDSGRTKAYEDKFRSFVGDCYFRFVVRENISGLTKEYQIRFDNTIVTSVNISGEMLF